MNSNIETPYVKIWKAENMLFCVFANKLDMDIEIAKHCVQARIKFSEGVSYPCLIDMKGMRSVTKAAREYMAKEGAMHMKAGALLIGSTLTKTIGNIFLMINKPEVPAKLFTDEKEAKEWLKQYI